MPIKVATRRAAVSNHGWHNCATAKRLAPFESETFKAMTTTSQTHDFLEEATIDACSSLATVEDERALQVDTLVLHYLSFVRSIASRMRKGFPNHVELDELVSAGLVGLVDAVHKFDPARDRQFAGYARYRIRGAILDFLRSLDWCPRELRKKKRFIDSNTLALTAYLGREPLEEEVATASNLSLAEYHDLLTRLHHSTIISTNTAARSNDGIETGELPISGSSEDDPLYQCIRNQTRANIAAALDELAERQRLVLTLYYYEELTMKEIADILGIAESRVSQIHAAALKNLRAKLPSFRKVPSVPADRWGPITSFDRKPATERTSANRCRGAQ